MNQFKLLDVSELDGEIFFYDFPGHEMTAISTKHKRPKGKTIAPLPKTAIALPTKIIHTI